MKTMRELLRRLRFLLRRPEYERDLEEEMAHHLAMLEENGRLPAAARPPIWKPGVA